MDSDFLRLARRVKQLEAASAGTETAEATEGENVTGPESATQGCVAVYADATGKVLAAGPEISTDSTMGGDSDEAVPTQKAVKAFALPKSGGEISGNMNVAGTLTRGGNAVWDYGNAGSVNKVPSLASGTTIPASADLNTYVAYGTYVCYTNATAATMVNKPVGYAGKLYVDWALGNSNYITQRYILYFEALEYTRYSTNGGTSWSAWMMSPVQARSGQCTLNSSSTVTVSFASGMSGTPRVMITPNTTVSGVIAGKIKNVSSAGFEAIIGGSGFSGIVFDYYAVYGA